MQKTELPAWCRDLAVDALTTFSALPITRAVLCEWVRDWKSKEFDAKGDAHDALAARRLEYHKEHGALYPDAFLGVPTCDTPPGWTLGHESFYVPLPRVPECLGWFCMCGWEVYQERVRDFLRTPGLRDPKYHLFLTAKDAAANDLQWHCLDFGCLFPPNLDPDLAPEPELPLPIEGRTLTNLERAVIVAAIYNRAGTGGKPIAPWPDVSPFVSPRLAFDNFCFCLPDFVLDAEQSFITAHFKGALTDLERHATADGAADTPEAEPPNLDTAANGSGGTIEIEAPAGLPKLVLPKEPSSRDWRVHYTANATSISNQTALADYMTEQGIPITQGEVSKAFKKVDAYLKAGGLAVPPEKLPKPKSLDPAIIEMGERRNQRTNRQRERPESLG